MHSKVIIFAAMQVSMFDVEPVLSQELISKKQSRSSGAKDAVSRYVRLKQQLDSDSISNGNWVEIDTLRSPSLTVPINFIDLFSGAGGISVGATQAGLTKLASVEIDKDASATIQHNFPDSVHFDAPIEQITPAMLNSAIQHKPIHIVFGGPPCQGFSVAGLRNSADPRNSLFREYIRVVKHVKPDFVVLENVPGILTMDQGRVYREIIHQFAEAGYPGMSVRILEAATFGVPQLRTRAIFVGNRLGIPNPYPKEIRSRQHYEAIEGAIDDLKVLPRNATTNHEWTQHSADFEARIADVAPGSSLYETFRDAFKRQYRGVPSMTVKENHGGCHIHYELNRVISVREMARLQTFPDDFIFSGTFKRGYWQVGNAVPCLLAKHIALAIKHALLFSGTATD